MTRTRNQKLNDRKQSEQPANNINNPYAKKTWHSKFAENSDIGKPKSTGKKTGTGTGSGGSRFNSGALLKLHDPERGLTQKTIYGSAFDAKARRTRGKVRPLTKEESRAIAKAKQLENEAEEARKKQRQEREDAAAVARKAQHEKDKLEAAEALECLRRAFADAEDAEKIGSVDDDDDDYVDEEDNEEDYEEDLDEESGNRGRRRSSPYQPPNGSFGADYLRGMARKISESLSKKKKQQWFPPDIENHHPLEQSNWYSQFFRF